MVLMNYIHHYKYFIVSAMWLFSCAIASASEAVAQSGSVAFIELVPLQTASSSDTTTTLPTPLVLVDSGQSYVVEVWAQTVDPQGLSSVSMTIQYDPAITVVNGVTHTALFSELSSGTQNNTTGLVVGLSGSHLSNCVDQVGVTPVWARVAILEMQAANSGITLIDAIDSGLPALGTAICGVGDLLPVQVSYGSATVNVFAPPIPTVSQWGMIVLVLMFLSVGTIIFMRLTPAPTTIPSNAGVPFRYL